MTRGGGTAGAAAWFVILGGISAALHVGKLSPAIPALQRDLGVSLVTSGLLLSLVSLASAAAGLVVGLVAERIGLRRSQLAGLVVLTVAGSAGGFVEHEGGLMVLRACEGVGFLFASVPAPALIRRLVQPASLSRMLGFWGAFIPVGAATALLAGPLVIELGRWPAWWWVTAAASALSALLVWWRVPPDPSRAATDGVPTASMRGRLAETLTTRGPWLVALAFACYSLQWLAVVGFLPSVYAASGWTGAMAAALASGVALANVVGNVLAGFALHHGFTPRTTLLVGFVSMAVGAFLAFGPPTAGLPVVQYAGAVLFSSMGGLVPGTLYSLAPRLAPDERTVSTTIGLMVQWTGFGQLAGPPAVAWLATQVGGWQWTWAATGAACLVGVGLALAMHAQLRRTAS